MKFSAAIYLMLLFIKVVVSFQNCGVLGEDQELRLYNVWKIKIKKLLKNLLIFLKIA